MRTILVIDDHVPTVTTLCLILNSRGYQALASYDAENAESQFRQNPVDLVVVDHGLPGIRGSALAGQLKTIRKVLVLMLSGNPELKIAPEEVDLLLPKPQAVPDLLAAIEKLFADQAA
ncbi:MAG: response regulator [Terriglobales bacterium]